jgi:hypothetical protein
LFNVSGGSLHRPKYLTFDIPEEQLPALDLNEQTQIVEINVSACSSTTQQNTDRVGAWKQQQQPAGRCIHCLEACLSCTTQLSVQAAPMW